MIDNARIRLNALYREEGWGKVSDAALGIEPYDVESQARRVAEWAHNEIERLNFEFNSLRARFNANERELAASQEREADLHNVLTDFVAMFRGEFPQVTNDELLRAEDVLSLASDKEAK